MFGGLNGVASTSRTQAVTNETSGKYKTAVDNWYNTNILGKPFESKIVDNIFCND